MTPVVSGGQQTSSRFGSDGVWLQAASIFRLPHVILSRGLPADIAEIGQYPF